MDELQSALDGVPSSEKTALLQALRQVPHLVRLESNPESYLRRDGSDRLSACMRICAYWATRVEFFGERAFLPLTFTGDGALLEEDVKILKTGFLVVLPNDQHGRAVVYHDRARLLSAEHLEMPIKRLRCLFYILSVVSESEVCLTNGLVYLTAYSDRTRRTSFDSDFLMRTVLFLKKDVFPFQTVAEHLVMCTTRPNMQTIVPMTLDVYRQTNFLSDRVTVHTGKPYDDLLDDLQELGFEMEGLPTIPLGGLFTFGCFRRWLDMRGREEIRRIGVQESGETAGRQFARLPESDDDEEEEARRKREIDAMYARRKRARIKIELKVLQREVQRLTKQNEEMRTIGAALEKNLLYAQSIVYSHEAHIGGLPWNLSGFSNAPFTVSERFPHSDGFAHFQDERQMNFQTSIDHQLPRQMYPVPVPYQYQQQNMQQVPMQQFPIEHNGSTYFDTSQVDHEQAFLHSLLSQRGHPTSLNHPLSNSSVALPPPRFFIPDTHFHRTGQSEVPDAPMAQNPVSQYSSETLATTQRLSHPYNQNFVEDMISMSPAQSIPIRDSQSVPPVSNAESRQHQRFEELYGLLSGRPSDQHPPPKDP